MLAGVSLPETFDSSIRLQTPSNTRFEERNFVNDRVVFWICSVPYDLAMKFLSDSPAGGVLYGYRIKEALFAECCVSPFNKCDHNFPPQTLPVGAFLKPKPDFGRN